ncbi:sugar ABC transporter substrate-binding protein [Parasphaerochaeta coccoides]|uniref:Sugar ABC transporter (Sugar-binding protein) n=1 Tax=Parasphaerochaeta coccoides (strain ATCC BAA-1237 / DSM 17374 / SPN1) TaxID=760011 RepID=F4GJJ5_PARC1|nr:sugar ABC transporter substrate-binding protein [Parasphaerochaeta coccoides]AEC02260.1 sugar ABC transporter (sugar-binding protein) [Parasphaerochaeta coccoides DSM 17374]
MKTIARKMMIILIVICVIMPTVLFAGGKKEQSNLPLIYVVMQGSQSMFPRYQVAAMHQYMETAHPAVSIRVVFADDDASNQLRQVETAVAEGAAAIVLNPVDKVQSGVAVDFAHAAGIPIITLSQSTNSQNETAFVGSDDIESGILQMQRLLEAAKEKGIEKPRFAYINAVLGHSAQVLREQAYKQELAKHPEVQLVVQNTADWSGEKALQLVENWIQIYKKGDDPGIDMIAAHADCILVGAITAVENAGLVGKVLLSGIDADMPVLEKIKAGVVDNTIWQDAVLQGETALKVAIEAAMGKKVETILIPFQTVTRANVDEYIQKANFRNELAAKYF